jgi:hypothetical protein
VVEYINHHTKGDHRRRQRSRDQVGPATRGGQPPGSRLPRPGGRVLHPRAAGSPRMIAAAETLIGLC